MEAFYDEKSRKDGVREWSLGREPPPPAEDSGFKEHTFTADKCPQLIGMEDTETKDTNPFLEG